MKSHVCGMRSKSIPAAKSNSHYNHTLMMDPHATKWQPAQQASRQASKQANKQAITQATCSLRVAWHPPATHLSTPSPRSACPPTDHQEIDKSLINKLKD